MLLLVVDIGNTNIVVGSYQGELLRRSWRISSRRDSSSDELSVLLRGLLADDATRVRDGIVASVVPPLTEPVMAAIEEIVGVEPLQVAPGMKTGLRVLTDNPQEVGADRIVNAVAAHARYPGPSIIVDFGTGTTLDIVTKSGDYLGGIIAPGPRLGADALSARAARLPRVDLSVPQRVVGKNSVDSIRSGILHGHAAMVDGLIRKVEEELGEAMRVVLTGGMAEVIGPLMERVDATDPDLTLEGLRLLYERNRNR